jgi:hypothetical protein
VGFQGEEIVCGLLPLNRISSDYCQSAIPLAHEKNFLFIFRFVLCLFSVLFLKSMEKI